jgi:hypothetical protein
MRRFTTPPKQRDGKFYVNSRFMFVTVSDTNLSREELLARLVAHYNPEECEVVREQHLNGRYHLHALLIFTRDRYLSVQSMRDKLNIPNLYLGYCLPGIRDYLLKEDTEMVSYPTGRVNELRETERVLAQSTSRIPVVGHTTNPNNVSNQVTEAILRGANLNAIKQSFKGFYLMNQGKIEKFYTEHKEDVKEQTKALNYLEWEELDFLSYPDLHDQLIAGWLNYVFHIKKLRDAGYDVQYERNCHLFVYGKTWIGKSRLMSVLRKYFGPVFDYHYNAANWQDDYKGGYSMICLDEFKDDEWGKVGGMNASGWNLFFDGLQKINQKYKAALTRDCQTPCLILSNKNIQDMFPEEDMDSRDAICKRMQIVQVPDGKQITVLSHLWDTNMVSFESYMMGKIAEKEATQEIQEELSQPQEEVSQAQDADGWFNDLELLESLDNF